MSEYKERAEKHLTEQIQKGDIRKADDDRYKKLERMYWEEIDGNCTFYGSDVPGHQIIDKTCKQWNFVTMGRNIAKSNIPGITTPYTYYGAPRATFAWHTEDYDLYSLNYIYKGEPKQWYVVPQSEGTKLEAMIEKIFPVEKKKLSKILLT